MHEADQGVLFVEPYVNHDLDINHGSLDAGGVKRPPPHTFQPWTELTHSPRLHPLLACLFLSFCSLHSSGSTRRLETGGMASGFVAHGDTPSSQPCRTLVAPRLYHGGRDCPRPKATERALLVNCREPRACLGQLRCWLGTCPFRYVFSF